MTLLLSLFSRKRKSRHPAAVTRREEAERARKASAEARSERLRQARKFAQRIVPLATPMRPRDEVVADIRRARHALQVSPASGGAENEAKGLVHRPYAGGNAGGTSPTLPPTRQPHRNSPSAGIFGRAS